MTTPTIKLNSGYEMPVLGIGCYILTPEEAENSVYYALKDGYRLIDTANVYMNERGVGRGMKRAIDEGICTREEIFLTTKLWPSEYEDVESAIKDTLVRLNTEYIDLLLLHQSTKVWKRPSKLAPLNQSVFQTSTKRNSKKFSMSPK